MDINFLLNVEYYDMNEWMNISRYANFQGQIRVVEGVFS